MIRRRLYCSTLKDPQAPKQNQKQPQLRQTTKTQQNSTNPHKPKPPNLYHPSQNHLLWSPRTPIPKLQKNPRRSLATEAEVGHLHAVIASEVHDFVPRGLPSLGRLKGCFFWDVYQVPLGLRTVGGCTVVCVCKQNLMICMSVGTGGR